MEHLFKGVCPVINLPFHKDYSIDYKGVAAIVNNAIADGCESLCLFAFNTEPHKLTAQEKKDTITRFMDIAKGRIRTLVGIVENSIGGGIELAQLVERCGGDGIILYPPSLSTPSGDALLGYFKAIADSVKIAVMIQDNPRSTGVTMPMEFLLKAYREIGNFNYIKVECPIPVRKMRKLIELTDGRLKCCSGNGGIFAMDAYLAGAWGIMPGVVTADRFVRMHRLFEEGNVDAARDIFENLLPLVWYEDQSLEFYISCEKELLRHKGVIAESLVRQPGETLGEADKAELYALYNRLK
jgi:4-hydroxy-tetrahydrodipicolinate synthase